MRRRPLSLTLIAFGVVLAGRSAPVRADSINNSVTYELINTSPAGSAPVDQVLTNVVPPGKINVNVPPPLGPLTIQPGSSGFDKGNLFVSVGDGTIPQGQPNAGNPYQLLMLTFENGGLKPGGILNFKLQLNDGATSPQIELPPATTGLQLVQLTQNQGGGTPPPPATNSDPPPSHTPEPLSLVLWSTLTGAGLLRARKVRLENLTRVGA